MYNRGVAVVGLGYIGLPTCAALAMHGVRVHGVDVDQTTVDAVNEGRVLIVEPDLDVAVAGAVSKGLLTASTQMPEADVFIIAVPTPFQESFEPNLSFVESAARTVAKRLTGGETVVLESTSPPGTTEKVSAWMAEERPDLTFPHQTGAGADVNVAHCPERVLPGRIMVELIENDRVVGGMSARCAQKASDLYSIFCRGEISLTSARVAEMTKLVENAYRDVNIAFANELANICTSLSLDVWDVIKFANRHPRVNVLNPGPGVGGHCIAVDPWFIVSSAPEQSKLIKTARSVNDERPSRVVKALEELASTGQTVACMGVAFKANIDDMRESPAVTVVARIAKSRPDLQLVVVEPHADSLPETLDFPNVSAGTIEASLAIADVVVLLVDHEEFRCLPASLLDSASVVDTRGVWKDLGLKRYFPV